MKHPEKGFFAQVYDLVEEIPAGKVLSYGDIAMILGNPRAARIVGYAMSSVPRGRNLPCHRVVYQDGSLVPQAFHGLKNHRRMLEEEGVTFLENGKIDMKKHSY